MQVRPEQIGEHLRNALKPVYLISGDEPLQVMEVADAIRHRAAAMGYHERDVLTVDQQFDWSQLWDAGQALSLFAQQKLLDLRLHSSKIGTAGSKAMKQYLERVPDDKVMLIQCPRLDKNTRNAAWVKAIDKIGVHVQVWDLSAAQTQAWLGRRMRDAGLKPSDEAVRYLAERIEGNLLAAVQEVHKLKLLHENQALSVDTVAESVADSSRFSVFDLAEAILAQDGQRICHIVRILREEGTALPLLVWALADLLRQLEQACLNVRQRQSNQGLFMRMPRARQQLFQQAIPRLQQTDWAALYAQLALLDQHSKGVGKQVSRSEQRLWTEVLDLALQLAGKSFPVH